MKQCAGIWLPDHEEHLLSYIKSSPRIDGAGTYQLHKLELALNHVGQRRVAVDIGAHVGLWSRILANHFDLVYAFEPHPLHCACFRRNVTAPNVMLHQVALGAADGMVRLSQPTGNSGHTYVADGGEIEATMQTLDNFGLGEVDFIKVDTEGYERDVILGALETLKTWTPTLIVEQKPNNGRRYGGGDLGALTLLTDMGAKIVAEKSGDYVLLWQSLSALEPVASEVR